MGDSDAPIRVPSSDAPYFPDIVEFSLSYNGYDRHGGLDGAAAIGERVKEEYEKSGEFPDDLDMLRCSLFWEQRYIRWNEQPPGVSPLEDAAYRDYIAGLVARIAEVSGGTVPGPGDPWP